MRLSHENHVYTVSKLKLFAQVTDVIAMKKYILLLTILSFSSFAQFDVDHAKLAASCPPSTSYKIIEVNRENKTSTYACLSNKNAKPTGHTFKVANWKKGNFLLEENTNKTKVKLIYANDGSVIEISSTVKGTQFVDRCKFKGGKSSETCQNKKKSYDQITKESISKQDNSFCTPNLDETTCTRYDGVKLVPAVETQSGMDRFIYEVENGLMIQTDVESTGTGEKK